MIFSRIIDAFVIKGYIVYYSYMLKLIIFYYYVLCAKYIFNNRSEMK